MRILFVGNSHTFRNGLPYQVRELINAALGEGACEVWMMTADGRSLGWHAGEPNTQLNLSCNRWDVVVLQQNTHPFAGYEQLAADYAKLQPYMEKTVGQVLLYVTWKRKDAPERDQEELNEAFARLASEQGARLVPVGPAWGRARQAAAETELYAPDGAHASPSGTYLAACVFFSVLTGRSPLGLPSKVVVNGTVLADLTPKQAESLQQIAAVR